MSEPSIATGQGLGTPLDFVTAGDEDGECLANLRVAAMRPSLEAIGRFDPARAKARFLESFTPDETLRIEASGQLLGFFVLRTRSDHLYLDHLYVLPDIQGKGIGTHVVRYAQQKAEAAKLPLRLVALRGSAANEFYTRHGFKLKGSAEFDNAYEWLATQASER
ncbi:GNAT family N-acetyltransferase [uncultured Roseibium sp.]|uniref:GNAT family N-acetyltransferase n=1 Tax=uncultured Roseibium sp. TaxID=1936171 RepID=UPI00259A57E1|nr:GNAT family N-acetyltransferase [uncultured Roseibium sp.]